MSRNEIIDKYFTNISLDKYHLDIYYVRKSILNAIENNLAKFNGVILDVGCGIMPYRELILKRNNNVKTYIGLDYESSIVEEYALGKPDLFWTGNIIPMENESADVVIATELFEHCPDPEKVMKEMLRVLKPRGLLFFTVPFLWNLHLVPFDEYRYTPFSLQRHLTNAGFVDIEMQSLGNWDASLAQMIGIWYQQRPMASRYKKLLAPIIMTLMKRLIKKDLKLDSKRLFENGQMITGLSGVAYK